MGGPDVAANRNRRVVGLWSLGLLAALTAALAYHANGELVHDVAWYFYATGRWLDGARLYVDVVEVNPPLIFYLMTPAVTISTLFELGPVSAVAIWLLVLLLCSLLLGVRIVSGAYRDGSHAWPPLLAAAALTSLFVPVNAFAQREHFAVVLALPYLFCHATMAVGARPGRVAASGAGLLAGIGLSLKPYFLLVPLVLEVRHIYRSGRPGAVIRPETVSGLAVAAVYGTIVVLAHPEYLRDIVPLALATYGSGFDLGLQRLATSTTTLFGAAAIATLWIGRRSTGFPAAADPFGWAAVAFFLAYLAQRKGFSYQVYPVAALAVLAIAPLVFAGPLVGKRGILRRPHRLAAAALLSAYLAIAFIRPPPRLPESLRDLVRRQAPDGTISALTTQMAIGFPLVLETGVEWGSRYPALWPLPGASTRLHAERSTLSPEERANLDWILSSTRTAVTEDLHRYRPDLVLVEGELASHPDSAGTSPLLLWALEDPEFRRMWAAYDSIGTWGRVTVYARERDRGAP